ncbi:DUF2771 family protein [Nocardia seriolae]|uniref:Uncharacterized protein n=1 Tax=Nocardia seriolae TaxID=37332 RepID=A0A0B8MZ92_9NOCA|nr:DUF2771 family protein [Nocardia seriolae]APB01809.1 hypothetical protein NS506_07791 [Nocardia seriolae]MTJ60734.1 DUF2771 family protein [Nocardia seriolae]MTJ70327.1 DUF2771 family protein [Nocardia seriolae]MTJ91121.1 DUF2771 family protein [Nocardia seriolae]MTK35083.1 DUF2771 family protein [Nocardia seriolae]
MSQSKTRTIAALAGAALLVFVAAVAAVVTIAVRQADKPDPEITAYAHGKSASVNPFLYCDLQISKDRLAMGKCDSSGAISDLDVPPGSTVQLSLPKEIANAPWELLIGYRLPGNRADGDILTSKNPWRLSGKPERDKDAKWDKPLTVTIKTPANEHVRLAIMELHLPIPARDEKGNEGVISRGIWALHTPEFDPALFS